MIDNKKIEEAANEYSQDNCGYSYNIEKCLAFEKGANWAINEFLKDLWHSISEEPRKNVSILVETHNDKNMFYHVWYKWQDNFYPSWEDAILCSRVSRWLYIDDLL
nr:MAG TPA: hypothetical protein [Crassvirales sp.]